MIIKSTSLIRFTNPSKQSTFNVRLVADKNFRVVIPTVFPVGLSTNWLKCLSAIAHIFLNFTVGDVGFRDATCGLSFIEIDAQEHNLCTFLLFGAKKKKQNPTSFRDSYLRNC